MIDNDKEFEEALKKYMKSKGVEMTEADFCEGLSCNDCDLKGGASEFVCSRSPFRTIDMYENKIKLLQREINIIDSWEKEAILGNKLQDVCKEIKRQYHDSGADYLMCEWIDCDKCIFNGGINNLYKWIEDQEKIQMDRISRKEGERG
jgi:hypothetical protein